MYTVTHVRNLDKFCCISHSANTIGKIMNPNILSSAIVEQTELLNLVRYPV